MTKSEKRECDSLTLFARANPNSAVAAGILARALAAMVRSAATTKSRNELVTFAAGWPDVVSHPDFIV